MSPRPERRADEGENVVMTISAQALATRWQGQYASGDHSGIADTFKLGTGGSAGPRPHELLEAALASCMIISARMELAEQGLDDAGVGVAVEVEREEALSRFRYIRSYRLSSKATEALYSPILNDRLFAPL